MLSHNFILYSRFKNVYSDQHKLFKLSNVQVKSIKYWFEDEITSFIANNTHGLFKLCPEVFAMAKIHHSTNSLGIKKGSFKGFELYLPFAISPFFLKRWT